MKLLTISLISVEMRRRMPLKIIGDLTQNDVRINVDFARESDGVIDLRGTGNTLIIDTHRRCRTVFIQLREASRCEMRAGARAIILNIVLHSGSEVLIGENTIANGKLTLQSHERGSITIGKNCLFGHNLQCFTSDMHSILDVASGDRVNPPGNVVVEDKVWAGFDVTLMKGSWLGSGSVVGARSTVTGRFPENSLVVGYPARLVRGGVSWAGELVPLPPNDAQVPPLIAS